MGLADPAFAFTKAVSFDVPLSSARVHASAFDAAHSLIRKSAFAEH